MSFVELTQRRRSVREFLPKAVDQSLLRAVLEAANAAPSAGNLQAYEVVCVSNKVQLGEVAAAAFNQTFIAEAAAALLFFANPPRSAERYGPRGTHLYCLQDASIACAYAELAAADLGLAAVWVGSFDGGKLAELVNAPQDVWPVAILPIGYPAKGQLPRQRRSLADLVRDGSF